eukprot:360430-Chlamydomonas_euryale.AAC.2
MCDGLSDPHFHLHSLTHRRLAHAHLKGGARHDERRPERLQLPSALPHTSTPRACTLEGRSAA